MKLPEFTWYEKPWPIPLLLIFGFCCWTFFLGNPLELQERQWFGQNLAWRLTWGITQPPDERIVHLDITQADLKELPSLEGEYAAIAKLILGATDLGAELIIFDVIYARGSQAIAQPIVNAIKASGKVLLAEGFLPKSAEDSAVARVKSFGFLPDHNIPAGIINIYADRDGVYRDYALVHPAEDGTQPSLALAAYLKLQDTDWESAHSSKNPNLLTWESLSADGLALEQRSLAVNPNHKPLLDFRNFWSWSGPEAFGHLSLSELTKLHQAWMGGPAASPRPLAGKVLFVAYVATGIADFGALPLAAHQPLVQLHSTMLNDLLQGTAHFRVSAKRELLCLAALLVWLIGPFIFRKQIGLTFFWLMGLGALVGLNFIANVRGTLVYPAVSMALLWSLFYTFEIMRRQTRDFVKRVKLKTTMGYYFSPAVLNKVLTNPGCMEPQEVEVSVLLTDLRNFTTLSEKLGAKGIFQLCNQVFEKETAAVLAEDGTLEHFLGDQFLCYWGAPDPQPDSADRALRAAHNLLVETDRLRESLTEDVARLFGYGIAIHTGKAMIGNRGSAQRLDYGILGDIINAAARVESLTKTYGVRMLVTREAFNKFATPPTARVIDRIIPLGKTVPLEILEVAHPKSAENFEKLCKAYDAAFRHYAEGSFSEAARQFTQLVQDFRDPASGLMVERCQALLQEPPDNWEGIYRFTHK